MRIAFGDFQSGDCRRAKHCSGNLAYAPTVLRHSFIAFNNYWARITGSIAQKIAEHTTNNWPSFNEVRTKAVKSFGINPETTRLEFSSPILILPVNTFHFLLASNFNENYEDLILKALVECQPYIKGSIKQDNIKIIKGIKNGWNGKTTETSSKLKIGKNFVYFDVLCTPYRNGGSNILGTIGVATNVTEKYLADEKIKEKVGETIIEKEKLSKIVQSIGEGVFVINEDRKLILSNRTACTLANLKHTENCCTGMDYRKIFKFFYEKDGKENKDFIDNVFKTKESQEVPIFNHHNTNLVGKNATPIPVSIKATPIKDNKDKIIGCVVIFKDVGEERKLDRTKSEFISVASHSLRTPISGVKWLAELLLEEKIGKLNKKQKHYLKKIQEANENSIELVNSLLIISRIESGKLSLVRRKKIKVFNLINKILIFYADKIKNKKLRFYLNCGLLEDTFIYLDEEKALIIFDNLIGNSIKYSKDGGRITLSCKKKHNKILFEIQDGGYGIPLKEQDKIFEKFFRGTNVQALKESGTGLGLFIVKSLIEAHGGKIWFDSEENKGTTFFFYLEK